MILRVDLASPLPPFEQIRRQIATMAATGTLAVGTRLPTVRRLAGDLGIAPGTVARAYRELDNDGVIETRGRHGTFVKPSAPAPHERSRLLLEAARAFALQVRQIGELDAAALAAARSALRDAPT